MGVRRRKEGKANTGRVRHLHTSLVLFRKDVREETEEALGRNGCPCLVVKKIRRKTGRIVAERDPPSRGGVGGRRVCWVADTWFTTLKRRAGVGTEQVPPMPSKRGGYLSCHVPPTDREGKGFDENVKEISLYSGAVRRERKWHSMKKSKKGQNSPSPDQGTARDRVEKE